MNHRKGKRNERALIRFLNTRVRWTPAFAQEIQGWNVMKGALIRGAEYAGKQWFQQEMKKCRNDTESSLDWDEFVWAIETVQRLR